MTTKVSTIQSLEVKRARQAEDNLEALLSLKRGNRPLEIYLQEFESLRQAIDEENFYDTFQRVSLIRTVGDPYATELRQLNFRTFNEMFSYLETRVLPEKTTFPELRIAVSQDLSRWTKEQVEEHNRRVLAYFICFYCKKNGHEEKHCYRRRNDMKKSRLQQKRIENGK